MRILPLFVLLLSLLIHTSLAKKKEKDSYWQETLNEVYEHATEASEKIVKVSAKAYDHVNKAAETSGLKKTVADTASAAYTGAASAAGYVKTVVTSDEVSQAASAAYTNAANAASYVKEVVTSKQTAQAASDAYATAAAAASHLGQKAVEACISVSATAFDTINQAIESGELKQKVAETASAAFAGAATAADYVSKGIESGELKSTFNQAAWNASLFAANALNVLGQKMTELSKGRQENETWTGFLSRVAKEITYEEEEGEVPARDDKKNTTWTEYFAFWRKESISERLFYNKDEDAKRTANVGYAAAMGELAGSFRQVNEFGPSLYKLLTGQGWAMRQINERGSPIYKSSLLGTAFGSVGNLFWYGAVAAESVNVVNAVAKDLDEGTSVNTVRASSKAVLSWTGASVGASAGATLFSVVPVVGTLAGGVIGGFAGAYSGAVAGEAAANAYAGLPKDQH